MVPCPEEIYFMFKKKSKKENKEAFNWASIFLTHLKIISCIHQQFLQWVEPQKKDFVWFGFKLHSILVCDLK